MGVAFKGLDKDIKLFPAISGYFAKLFINFGEHDLKFGGPDHSFEKLIEVIEESRVDILAGKSYFFPALFLICSLFFLFFTVKQ